jgi:hypothetical protein
MLHYLKKIFKKLACMLLTNLINIKQAQNTDDIISSVRLYIIL